MNLRKTPFLLLTTLLGALTLGASCKKPAPAPAAKPWPVRPVKLWKEKIGTVTFEVKLPEGLGIFRDPRARIWRVDNLGLGPMVSVSRSTLPKTLQDAMEETIREEMESFGKGEPLPDGFWVTVKNRDTGELKVYRWLRLGDQTLRCFASFFWRGQKPREVPAHNALLERICRSVTLQSGVKP